MVVPPAPGPTNLFACFQLADQLTALRNGALTPAQFTEATTRDALAASLASTQLPGRITPSEFAKQLLTAVHAIRVRSIPLIYNQVTIWHCMHCRRSSPMEDGCQLRERAPVLATARGTEAPVVVCRRCDWGSGCASQLSGSAAADAEQREPPV